jgi:hypothetical protein
MMFKKNMDNGTNVLFMFVGIQKGKPFLQLKNTVKRNSVDSNSRVGRTCGLVAVALFFRPASILSSTLRTAASASFSRTSANRTASDLAEAASNI